MRTGSLLALVFLVACQDSRGVGGRWQGASDPGASPVTVAFTLRVIGDSLRGWGVARTDGRSFPITAHGITGRDTVYLVFAPWRSGVVDIESAQLSGRLDAHGHINATLRTDGGIGEGPVTPITLTRPAHSRF